MRVVKRIPLSLTMVLLFSACGFGGEPTADVGESFQLTTEVQGTSAAATLQSMAIATGIAQTQAASIPSATPIPATEAVSTQPPAPTSTSAPEVEANGIRLNFPEGGTSATVIGDLAAGEVDSYVLRALERQILSLNFLPNNNSSSLRLEGVDDGITYLEIVTGESRWLTPLPTTQDYIVRVTAQESTSYTLFVSVPARFEFASGASSATVEGTLEGPDNPIIEYWVAASAGQEMTLTLDTAWDYGLLNVAVRGGTDNVQYLQFIDRPDGKLPASWSMTLPSTQDYLIIVELLGISEPEYGLPSDYSLEIKIE